MATYEKHHCWSILLRLFHWMFALSIVFLVTTGFYINDPWTNTLIEGSASFPMANMRYIHYLAAYVFASAVAIRLFLYIFGNAQERIMDILPIGRNLKNLFMTLMQYSYISDKHDERLGHNILAGLAYLFTFIAAMVMMFSGFYMLFPKAPFWEVGAGGFRQPAICPVSPPSPHVVVHDLRRHPYLSLYMERLKQPEGLISSIFTGAKFKHKA